jgi:hypothetical protein
MSPASSSAWETHVPRRRRRRIGIGAAGQRQHAGRLVELAAVELEIEVMVVVALPGIGRGALGFDQFRGCAGAASVGSEAAVGVADGHIGVRADGVCGDARLRARRDTGTQARTPSALSGATCAPP